MMAKRSGDVLFEVVLGLLLLVLVLGGLGLYLLFWPDTPRFEPGENEMRNRARFAVHDIIQCNFDKDMRGSRLIWPDLRTKEYAFTSTAYFRYLLEQGELRDTDVGSFQGCGLSGPSGGKPFCADNNAWKIVAGFRGYEPDTIPFIFTRNAGITTDDIRNWPQGDGRIPLDANAVPFGRKKAIVLSKGGDVVAYRAKSFRWNAVWSTTNRYDYLEVWDVE